jgi:tripartite-type tricarboxylate transporter receptor subunit TctC
MKFRRRQFLHLAAGAAAVPAISRIARAQAYPTRPITMIVAFAAGGGTDVIGRIIIERMRASLGQPVVIENVAGASGNIGTGRVARAAPDGYTLSLSNLSGHVLNGAVFTLPYDALRDFEPISLVATNPLLIAARKSMPARDLKEFIAWLKANMEKTSAGTSGIAPDIPTAMRLDCPDFILPIGPDFGHRKARLETSSVSSMPLWWMPWPIQKCASDSPTSDR